LSLRGIAGHFAFEEREGDTAIDAVGGKPLGKVRGTAKWGPGKRGNAFQGDGQSYVEAAEWGAVERTEPFSFAAWIHRTTDSAVAVLSKMHDSAAFRGYDVMVESGRVAVHMIHHWPDNGLKVITRASLPKGEWHHLVIAYDGSSRAAGVRIYFDGKLQELEVTHDHLRDTIATDRPFHVGRRGEGNAFQGLLDEVQWYRVELSAEDALRLANGETAVGLQQILETPPGKRNADQIQQLKNYFLGNIDPTSKSLREELAAVKQRRETLDAMIPTSLVMEDLPQPRQTFVLTRGQYDRQAEAVQAGVPRALPAMDGQSPANRLGLARWLIAPSHPLTARVAVNRWWGLLWSAGLVDTAEDFGVQGAWPSHPELLDWLAVSYRSPRGGSDLNGPTRGMGWDTKLLLRMLALSAAYRQSSDANAELRERDPANRWLTRGARVRLPAEMLRDSALAASGLLVERLGGPSVMPYQPEGLWEEVSVERRVKYKPDSGAGLYRRSFYTFWKRTCPPPGMTTLDAPDREFCVIRRARTNTPLQALILMNDTTYVEAARLLAERILRETGAPAGATATDDATATAGAAATADARMELALRLTVYRSPTAEERVILQEMVQRTASHFRQHPEEANKLVSVGAMKADSKFDSVELAAWTAVASVLLNLDEAMTKE
jgi:hypothetical protein